MDCRPTYIVNDYFSFLSADKFMSKCRSVLSTMISWSNLAHFFPLQLLSFSKQLQISQPIIRPAETFRALKGSESVTYTCRKKAKISTAYTTINV